MFEHIYTHSTHTHTQSTSRVALHDAAAVACPVSAFAFKHTRSMRQQRHRALRQTIQLLFCFEIVPWHSYFICSSMAEFPFVMTWRCEFEISLSPEIVDRVCRGVEIFLNLEDTTRFMFQVRWKKTSGWSPCGADGVQRGLFERACVRVWVQSLLPWMMNEELRRKMRAKNCGLNNVFDSCLY